MLWAIVYRVLGSDILSGHIQWQTIIAIRPEAREIGGLNGDTDFMSTFEYLAGMPQIYCGFIDLVGLYKLRRRASPFDPSHTLAGVDE